MRAITYSEFGEAEAVLQLTQIETPSPAAGEVLVRLKTTAVNPSDVKARAGGRPGVTEPPFPLIIPHSDGAGIIEQVGDNISAERVGEAVWIWNGQWQRAFGTAAEYICLPAEQAVPLPEGVTFAHAAIFGIPGLTAAHAVLGAGDISGQRVLVSGGAGVVGHLAVQIAALSGAEVFATCSEPDKEAVKAAGAHHVFDYREPKLADEIRTASQGKLIDKIIEVEFGRNAQTNAAIIAEGGHIVSYGSAQDMSPTLPFYPLMFKAVSIDLMLVYLLEERDRKNATSALNRLAQSGRLDFRIASQMPLSACADAHNLVATGNRKGSVILNIDDTL